MIHPEVVAELVGVDVEEIAGEHPGTSRCTTKIADPGRGTAARRQCVDAARIARRVGSDSCGRRIGRIGPATCVARVGAGRRDRKRSHHSAGQ